MPEYSANFKIEATGTKKVTARNFDGAQKKFEKMREKLQTRFGKKNPPKDFEKWEVEFEDLEEVG